MDESMSVVVAHVFLLPTDSDADPDPGPGAFLTPLSRIRVRDSGRKKNPDPGSRMNIPDLIFENLVPISFLGLKSLG